MCLVPHSDLMETGAVALAVELVALFGLITWRIIVGRKRRAEILARQNPDHNPAQVPVAFNGTDV